MRFLSQLSFRIRLALVLFILATILLLFWVDYSEEQIFPYPIHSATTTNLSHEEVPENFSKVQYHTNTDSSLTFEYSLSSSVEEPFAGVYFHKIKGENLYFDFSTFDEVRMVLDSKNAKRIPVYLTIDYPHLNSEKEKLLAMPLRQIVDYEGKKEYVLPKKGFEIPSWWFRYHKIPVESIQQIDFSKVNYILVNSCQILKPGVQDEITISSIRFTHNNQWKYVSYGGFILLLIGYVYFTTPKKPIKILLPYKIENTTTSEPISDSERIAQYIAEHFSNAEISVKDIQLALGISPREIGAILKKEYGLSFKAYVNTIRLFEIKRLLKDTDWPISDIAYKMGYNNISHFNRVFKKDAGVSPKEFRDGGE